MKQLKKEEELSKNGRLSYYPIQHSTTSPEYNKKLEDIIKHITSVHLQQTPHTPEFFEKLPGKEKEFLVSFCLLFVDGGIVGRWMSFSEMSVMKKGLTD